MRPRSLVLLALLLTASLIARAYTIQTFDLFAINQGYAGYAHGTVGLDLNTGQFVSANFGVDNIGYTYSGVFTTPPDSQVSDLGNGVTDVAFRYSYTDPGNTPDHGSGYDIFVDFVLPTSDLRGYLGGSLCSVDMPCGGVRPVSTMEFDRYRYGILVDDPGYYEQDQVQYGSLTPVAPTPEPATLLLLLTGTLGLAGVARGRLSRIAQDDCDAIR